MGSGDSIQRVFLTGGSGFVGGAVLRELLERGVGVNALVNRATVDGESEVREVRGGLFDESALDEGMGGAQAVIHLVGIIEEDAKKGITFDRIHFEGSRGVIDAARRSGVRRFVLMSANGVRGEGVSAYHKSKWRAEEYLRASGLEWTIIRPSMIHGPGGAFTGMLAGWAQRKRPPYLFMPYFGGGVMGFGRTGMLQPVHVDDVARAFVDALSNPATVGRAYELGGPEVYTWPRLHRAAADAIVGKNRAVVPIPAWYAKLLAGVLPARILPFNRDQVIMALEDNTVDLEPFERDFGWRPRPFAATLREYAPMLR